MYRTRKDRDLFAEEAMPHMGALHRFARGMTGDAALAEDMVQETYKEAWQSFHRYSHGTDCKAWLFRILFRVWNRQQRKSAPWRAETTIEEAPESALAIQPELRHLEHEDVLRVLHSLPRHYQMVLVLADVEEFSYKEIARLMELPMGTVMSRVSRARKLFRSKFIQESQGSRSA